MPAVPATRCWYDTEAAAAASERDGRLKDAARQYASTHAAAILARVSGDMADALEVPWARYPADHSLVERDWWNGFKAV
jgi:hypothetical protein